MNAGHVLARIMSMRFWDFFREEPKRLDDMIAMMVAYDG